MMDTIELLKEMQEKCLNGYKYDDPLRMKKYRALEEAIKSLEDQPKYEKALDMICNDYFDDMADKDETFNCSVYAYDSNLSQQIFEIEAVEIDNSL